jgi:hypothetical protein
MPFVAAITCDEHAGGKGSTQRETSFGACIIHKQTRLAILYIPPPKKTKQKLVELHLHRNQLRSEWIPFQKKAFNGKVLQIDFGS